ncbi:hypothetical protein PINS_up000964 [Pythium insidiosum]|nr:hypothetical protein PINS_up000964 [Pythium insidiosum]
MDDISTEICLCPIEIMFGLIHGACCYNAATVNVAAALILAFLLHNTIRTWLYLSVYMNVNGREAISTARKIIRVAKTIERTGRMTSEVDSTRSLGMSSARTSIGDHEFAPEISPMKLVPGATYNRFLRQASQSRLADVRDEPGTDNAKPSGWPGVTTSHAADNPTDQSVAQPKATSQSYSPSPEMFRRNSVDRLPIGHRDLTNVLLQALQLLFTVEVVVINAALRVSVMSSYFLLSLTMSSLGRAIQSADKDASLQHWHRVGFVAAAVGCELIMFGALLSKLRARNDVGCLWLLILTLRLGAKIVHGKLVYCVLVVVLMTLETKH